MVSLIDAFMVQDVTQQQQFFQQNLSSNSTSKKLKSIALKQARMSVEQNLLDQIKERIYVANKLLNFFIVKSELYRQIGLISYLLLFIKMQGSNQIEFAFFGGV
eukprot:TRINITY_DN19528_c0_g1_i2.p4 TRINITY_DN19528_c0_g1~~TRINITY_DN19528_c0_g1_i2.p4  ORF type:complete len:104 (-),score=2.59 TRINITY_DN19528_c0_g1_i2:93-404(-)